MSIVSSLVLFYPQLSLPFKSQELAPTTFVNVPQVTCFSSFGNSNSSADRKIRVLCIIKTLFQEKPAFTPQPGSHEELEGRVGNVPIQSPEIPQEELPPNSQSSVKNK